MSTTHVFYSFKSNRSYDRVVSYVGIKISENFKRYLVSFAPDFLKGYFIQKKRQEKGKTRLPAYRLKNDNILLVSMSKTNDVSWKMSIIQLCHVESITFTLDKETQLEKTPIENRLNSQITIKWWPKLYNLCHILHRIFAWSSKN